VTAGASAGFALAALGLAVTVAWQAATVLRLDLAFTAAETELSFWGRGDYQPEDATRQRTAQALEALLAAAPRHPDYLAQAAYHDAWRAYREDDPALAQPYALRALHNQYGAQQARPAYRQGWEKMVGYARRAAVAAEGVADGAFEAAESAAVLGALAQQRVDALQPAAAEAAPFSNPDE
jgi:hypothetical protein